MGVYQQGTPIKITDTFRVGGVETTPTQVVYTIQNPDGTEDTFTWPGAVEIANTGVGVFVFSLGAPDLPGFYTYDVDATGAVVASRQGSFSVLPNAQSDAEVTWAVPGPCDAWTSAQDVWACCGQPMVTVDDDECAVDMTAFALAASQVLFELSGRRFSGSCQKTVRPCSTTHWCGFQVLSRGHIVGWGGSTWMSNGVRSCGCRPLDRILLSGYPVREVLEVKIDGDVVDPDTYRLDERRYLSRVRDPADPDTFLTWPACQAMDLPDTEDGTFSVTYRYGMDPPLIGSLAAAQLACQLYKSCTGAADCELPIGATRINRQGVTIERPALVAWGLQEGIWRTSMERVDTFLNAFNIPRMTRRPSTWSPDGLRYARQVGS